MRYEQHANFPFSAFPFRERESWWFWLVLHENSTLFHCCEKNASIEMVLQWENVCVCGIWKSDKWNERGASSGEKNTHTTVSTPRHSSKLLRQNTVIVQIHTHSQYEAQTLVLRTKWKQNEIQSNSNPLGFRNYEINVVVENWPELRLHIIS